MGPPSSPSLTETPQFPLTGEGNHLEAYYKQLRLYQVIFNSIRTTRSGPLSVLDYGCGNGISRSILQNLIEPADTLSLYDITPLERPTNRNVRIVPEEQVFGDDRLKFSYVNISYVLCLLEEPEQLELITRIRKEHAGALLCIVDYTLKGMDEAEMEARFQSQKEMQWRNKLGFDNWYRTHTRFTREALARLVMNAGYHPFTVRNGALDKPGYRAYVIARGDCR